MQEKQLQQKRGMTLVEVVVVTTMFTLIMSTLALSISSLYRANAYTLAQAYQVEYARRGVDTMVRDLREMTFADDGTFPLVRMEDHVVGFYSDIDRDQSVEYVEYELAADTILYKRVYDAAGDPVTYDTSTPDATYVLSEYVQNLTQGTSTFYYYDANGDPATGASTVTDIRYIRVQSIVNVDPIRDPGQFMLRSSATLRNVVDNL